MRAIASDCVTPGDPRSAPDRGQVAARNGGAVLAAGDVSQADRQRESPAHHAKAPQLITAEALLPGTTPVCASAAPDPSALSLRVRCLGNFEITVAGVPIDSIGRGKVGVLFQYLLTHRDRPIPRDVLVQSLWPNPNAAAPGTSLKVAVHALRRLLAASSAAASLSLEACSSGYRLCASGVWIDVEEFERSDARGRHLDARGLAEEALVHYAQAAALYRGDFLHELWDDWVVVRREGLKDRYVNLLTRLTNGALAKRRYQECILTCQQLLDVDRCREDSYRTLMLCHARLGQRGRVRAWYDVCVRTLRTELDVAPEPETEGLYRRALRGPV